MAALYPGLRPKLDEPARSALDDLLAPFAGQWMKPHVPPQPTLDLPAEMKLLAFGGLSVALSPDHCARIAAALRASAWHSQLAAVFSENDDEKTFERMVSELALLILAVAEKKSGVIAGYET